MQKVEKKIKKKRQILCSTSINTNLALKSFPIGMGLNFFLLLNLMTQADAGPQTYLRRSYNIQSFKAI